MYLLVIGLKNMSLCHLTRSNTTTNHDYPLYTFPCSVPATSICFKFWFNKIVHWILNMFISPEWLYGFLTLTWKPSAVHYIWEPEILIIQQFFKLFLPHTLKGKLLQNSCTHVFSFASSHLYMATESRNDIERFNHFWSSVHRRICRKIKTGTTDCDFILVHCHWQKSGIPVCAKLKPI